MEVILIQISDDPLSPYIGNREAMYVQGSFSKIFTKLGQK